MLKTGRLITGIAGEDTSCIVSGGDYLRAFFTGGTGILSEAIAGVYIFVVLVRDSHMWKRFAGEAFRQGNTCVATDY